MSHDRAADLRRPEDISPDLMERARELRQRVVWSSNESVEAVALALADAKASGAAEQREKDAVLLDQMAEGKKVSAESTLRDWTGPDCSPGERESNRQYAAEEHLYAVAFSGAAAAIRNQGLRQ